jgi:AdoMet-dependent rRNA methyltransferase SPB1
MHDQSSDDESDDEEGPKSLVRKLDGQDEKTAEGLTKRAALFFNQDVFAEISEDDGAEEEESDGDDEFAGFSDEDGDVTMEDAEEAADDGFETEEEDDGFEVVKAPKNDSNWDADDEPMKNGRPGKNNLPAFLVSCLLLTANRYRHYYCGSHDARTAACQW